MLFALGLPPLTHFAVIGRPWRWLSRRLADPRAPLVALAIVCAVGVGARVFHLGIPAPTRTGGGYVFDERYYVSAARTIAGLHAHLGDAYAGKSPSGADPNGEHPQLGKLVIAAGILLLGDNAIGWRSTAVLFGLASLLLLYWLVRCAGGSRWLGVGATALASVENLWVVSSRIAVLDIYVVPFMLAGVGLYLRRRPLLAGVLLGVGCTVKEFAAYGVLIVALFELMRVLARVLADRRAHAVAERPPGTGPLPAPAHGSRVRALLAPVAVALVAAVTYFTLQAALDAAITPYSNGQRVDRNQAAVCSHLLIWKGACNHFVFINDYASKLRGPPKGIASTPLQFWLNRKAINYFAVTRRVSLGAKVLSTEHVLWFRGEIGRVLLFTSWLAIVLNVWWAIRRRDSLSLLVVAWILGTWLPPELFNLVDQRTTYLYYMVVTMPALYIAVARLLAVRWVPRLLVALWVAAMLWDFVSLYPIRTLSGT